MPSKFNKVKLLFNDYDTIDAYAEETKGGVTYWFTKSSGQRIADSIRYSASESILRYDAKKDAFIEILPDVTDVGVFAGKDCQTVDGAKHLYPIGDDYWIWDEVDDGFKLPKATKHTGDSKFRIPANSGLKATPSGSWEKVTPQGIYILIIYQEYNKRFSFLIKDEQSFGDRSDKDYATLSEAYSAALDYIEMRYGYAKPKAKPKPSAKKPAAKALAKKPIAKKASKPKTTARRK